MTGQVPDFEAEQAAALPAAPTAKGERLVALDLIRGIAVLGILLANVVAFGHPDLAYYWPGALPGGGNRADQIAWLVQFVAVDGKFRGLFSLLFGAGMVLFYERLGASPRAFLLQARRLAWLLVFGALHFWLLFHGDILFSYACAGVICLAALEMKGDRLVALGLIWFVIGALFQVLAYITPALVEAGSLQGETGTAIASGFGEYWNAQLAEAAAQTELMQHASYWQIVRHAVLEESGTLFSYFTYIFFETIPLVLLGMGLFKLGLFAAHDPEAERRPQAWAWGGVAVGFSLNLAAGWLVFSRGFPPFLTQLASFGLSNLANLPLLMGAVVLLARWAARPHDGWLAERLVLAGRMAFTNYVGTSLVMLLVFQGWAGGLYGQLHRVELLGPVALGWALMLTFSRLWLSRFRYGPLEWLWRCLTWWKLFPNRLPM